MLTSAIMVAAMLQIGGPVEPYSILEIPPGVHRLMEPIRITGPSLVRGSGIENTVLIPPAGQPAIIITQTGRRGILARDREWSRTNQGVNVEGFTIGGKRGDGQTGIVFHGPCDHFRIENVRWAWLDEPIRCEPNARGAGSLRESWFVCCETMGCGPFVIEQTPEIVRGDGHNNIKFMYCDFNQNPTGSNLIIRNRSRQESLRRIYFVKCFVHTHQRWNDAAIDVNEPWEPLIVIDASQGRMGAISFFDCDLVMGAAHNTAGNLRTGVKILGEPTNVEIRTTYTGGGPVVDLGTAENVWLELSRTGSAAGSLVRWQGTATHRLESR